jgi:histone H3/H4
MTSSGSTASASGSKSDIPAVTSTPFKRRSKPQHAIPKTAFRRLVTEIADKLHPDLRFQSSGLDILQETAENVIAEHFRDSSKVAELCRLDTVRKEHWQFAREGKVPC